MTAGKLQQQASQSMFSLKGSLLTLAIVTLISFTYLSLDFLHSSPSSSSSSASPTQLSASIIQPTTTTTTTTETQNDKCLDDDDDEISSDLYHLPKIFKWNYKEMEKNFKVFIYPDGDPNTFYQTPRKLTGKYASEGYFFQNIRESRFRTEDPDQAHLFFIPISCHKMRGKVRVSQKKKN